jgi:diaminopimelate epimerase
MNIPFTKMHGLGNDFVILDMRTSKNKINLVNIPHLGDRRRGIGFDQLLTLFPSKNDGDIFMQINNPDGSEAEACGNGTRCVADLMMSKGNIDNINIETVAGTLSCWRTHNNAVVVNMGNVKTHWQEIPLSEATDTLNIKLDGAPFSNCTCVNIGNPHAVFFCDDADDIPLNEVGPILENHKIFPQRANIEFATVRSKQEIRMRVWERGAGITEACGSGACAVLVAAVRNGFTARRADVILDGGCLSIEWAMDDTVLMTGPTEISFHGEITI